MSATTYRAIFIGAGVLLLIAIGDMPWGYYQLLRWLVVVAGVLLIVRALQVSQSGWAVLGGLSVVFFFPPFGVSFEKEIWAVLDFMFGVAFILSGFLLKKTTI